ncbi:hypothetical protein [Nocardioides mangrovi]|uniref:WD40 repeat domain-containing protein n=1 Tax=Nocardioides mangrovi TaxID=2874580 RepID=A0ABS7U8D2_9ACTN|nr:hypothetical protein [Nocardioides mangrovi]MBZ5737230.1 hypothetical protein [Nocardioides mangrovi]
MTDRLSTLMHQQVDALEVPPAPAAQVIAAGRGLRRRRTAGVAAAVVATVLAVIGIAVVDQRWSDDDAITPAEQKAYVEKGAWAVGNELHIGDHVVTLPGIDQIGYSSLGAIVFDVRPGQDYDSTTSETVLVTPDGKVRSLALPGLDLLLNPPATDPTSPVIAYVRPSDAAQGDVVLADLSTGETTVFSDAIPPHQGQVRSDPVALTPDAVLVNNTWSVDRSTGDRTRLRLEGLTPLSGYAHGLRLTSDWQTMTFQVRSGDDVLLDLPDTSGTSNGQSPALLSPDGRYVAVSTGDAGLDVYTVASGRSIHLGGDWDLEDVGWTPDGHLVGKQYPTNASEVQTCDPVTGTCVGTGITVTEELRLVRGADAIPNS